MKKFIGQCMMGMVFVGLFVLMALDLGLKTASAICAVGLVVVCWLIVACLLIEEQI